jgi:hypothetical protein
MASGMHFVSGLLNFSIGTQEWTQGFDSTAVLFVISSWFLSVPVGLLIGRFLLIKCGKKMIGVRLENEKIYWVKFNQKIFSSSLLDCSRLVASYL